MSSDDIITSRSLLVTRESRVPTAVALLVTAVMMTVTMVDFVGDLRATDTFTSKTPDWNITFDVQTYTMQAVETLQDDETRNLEFDMAEVGVLLRKLQDACAAAAASSPSADFPGSKSPMRSGVASAYSFAEWRKGDVGFHVFPGAVA